MVPSLKTSRTKASAAPNGDGGRAVLGPVIHVDSAAQVPVHSLRDRGHLPNFRPCQNCDVHVVVKVVSGAVKVTEQADRELTGGNVVMQDRMMP